MAQNPTGPDDPHDDPPDTPAAPAFLPTAIQADPAPKRRKPTPGKPRNRGKFGKPTYNQAQKIVRRFGSEANLSKLIGVSRVSVYRWQYRRPYGSDGLVPSMQIEKIKAVARVEGVLIRPEDWVPETVFYDEETSQPLPTNSHRVPIIT